MTEKIKEAYGEIVRLRNEAYKKWIETPTDDEYNRVVTKAKFQAYEKCMELLTPSIVDPQPKESIEYNPFDDFRHTDSEEPVSEDMEAEFLRAAHNLREQPTLSAWFRHFYNLGKQQIMKGFPTWKRSGKLIEGALLDREILYIPRYMIELSELKKLPKEE